MTDEQKRQVRQSAEQAYDKLRWYLGDSRELLEELQLLARDSWLEGARQERNACAAECDRLTTDIDGGGNEYRREATASACASAIRARSNA